MSGWWIDRVADMNMLKIPSNMNLSRSRLDVCEIRHLENVETTWVSESNLPLTPPSR